MYSTTQFFGMHCTLQEKKKLTLTPPEKKTYLAIVVTGH